MRQRSSAMTTRFTKVGVTQRQGIPFCREWLWLFYSGNGPTDAQQVLTVEPMRKRLRGVNWGAYAPIAGKAQ